MALKIMTIDGVRRFLERLGEQYRVIGPKAEGGKFVFKELKDVEELALEYPIALYPVKGFLLPPKEEYLRYRKDGKVDVVAMMEEVPPTVFFGIRPCDLNSLWLLDEAFIKEGVDVLYETKRKKFLFVVLDCLVPCDEYAFCRDVGSLYVEGYDVLLTRTTSDEIASKSGKAPTAVSSDGGKLLEGPLYIVRAQTEKGEKVLKDYADLVVLDVDEGEVIKKIYEEREEVFGKRLKVEKDAIPDVLWRAYDSPYWEEVASKCLSCGSCNLVCPTCYCFDVVEEIELNLKEGKRYRTWDSCMLMNFALVASGENFRHKRFERLRHRFLRKGKYLLDRYGKIGCVGCGRCTRHCLVKINPIEVYNTLYNLMQAEV